MKTQIIKQDIALELLGNKDVDIKINLPGAKTITLQWRPIGGQTYGGDADGASMDILMESPTPLEVFEDTELQKPYKMNTAQQIILFP